MHKWIHLYANVHTHTYTVVSVTTIKEIIGHDFEREQSVVYRRIWREERKWKHDSIISKSNYKKGQAWL